MYIHLNTEHKIETVVLLERLGHKDNVPVFDLALYYPPNLRRAQFRILECLQFVMLYETKIHFREFSVQLYSSNYSMDENEWIVTDQLLIRLSYWNRLLSRHTPKYPTKLLPARAPGRAQPSKLAFPLPDFVWPPPSIA